MSTILPNCLNVLNSNAGGGFFGAPERFSGNQSAGGSCSGLRSYIQYHGDSCRRPRGLNVASAILKQAFGKISRICEIFMSDDAFCPKRAEIGRILHHIWVRNLVWGPTSCYFWRLCCWRLRQEGANDLECSKRCSKQSPKRETSSTKCGPSLCITTIVCYL